MNDRSDRQKRMVTGVFVNILSCGLEEKMKKKAIAILMICVMTAAALSGCGNSADTGTEQESEAAAEEMQPEENAEPEENPAETDAEQTGDVQASTESTDGVKDTFGYDYVGQDLSSELTMYKSLIHI